ncbi:hypothetical protein R3Q17_25200 [Rhodococcus opacus]|nr:hypothetical protein [Rhodococcus opacus]
MPSDPFAAVGEYLTANEAIGLAVLLEAGEHTAHARRSVNADRGELVATIQASLSACHMLEFFVVVRRARHAEPCSGYQTMELTGTGYGLQIGAAQ